MIGFNPWDNIAKKKKKKLFLASFPNPDVNDLFLIEPGRRLVEMDPDRKNKFKKKEMGDLHLSLY